MNTGGGGDGGGGVGGGGASVPKTQRKKNCRGLIIEIWKALTLHRCIFRSGHELNNVVSNRAVGSIGITT